MPVHEIVNAGNTRVAFRLIKSIYVSNSSFLFPTLSMPKALEFVKAQGGRVLWVAAVSTIMVLVPVLFEVQREGQCLNLER